jgi:membrane-associated phospholipid phosphatase
VRAGIVLADRHFCDAPGQSCAEWSGSLQSIASPVANLSLYPTAPIVGKPTRMMHHDHLGIRRPNNDLARNIVLAERRQRMTRALVAWLLALFATVAFVLFSIQWLDRPIAVYFSKLIPRERLPIELADRIFSIPSIAAILFVLLGLRAVNERRFSKVETVIALCTIGTLIMTVIKDQLKFVFGRTWPYLLQHDVYEFNFFKSGSFLESFPSGHAAVAATVLSIVWSFFPKARSLCTTVFVVANFGLVALSLHYLSDVVAGTFAGVSVGLFTVAIWTAGYSSFRVDRSAD